MENLEKLIDRNIEMCAYNPSNIKTYIEHIRKAQKLLDSPCITDSSFDEERLRAYQLEADYLDFKLETGIEIIPSPKLPDEVLVTSDLTVKTGIKL